MEMNLEENLEKEVLPRKSYDEADSEDGLCKPVLVKSVVNKGSGISSDQENAKKSCDLQHKGFPVAINSPDMSCSASSIFKKSEIAAHYPGEVGSAVLPTVQSKISCAGIGSQNNFNSHQSNCVNKGTLHLDKETSNVCGDKSATLDTKQLKSSPSKLEKENLALPLITRSDITSAKEIFMEKEVITLKPKAQDVPKNCEKSIHLELKTYTLNCFSDNGIESSDVSTVTPVSNANFLDKTCPCSHFKCTCVTWSLDPAPKPKTSTISIPSSTFFNTSFAKTLEGIDYAAHAKCPQEIDDSSHAKCQNEINDTSSKCVQEIDASRKCPQEIDDSSHAKCQNKIDDASCKCPQEIDDFSHAECQNEIDASHKCAQEINDASHQCAEEINASHAKCPQEIEASHSKFPQEIDYASHFKRSDKITDDLPSNCQQEMSDFSCGCKMDDCDCALIDKEAVLNNLHMAASIAKHMEPVNALIASQNVCEISQEQQQNSHVRLEAPYSVDDVNAEVSTTTLANILSGPMKEVPGDELRASYTCPPKDDSNSHSGKHSSEGVLNHITTGSHNVVEVNKNYIKEELNSSNELCDKSTAGSDGKKTCHFLDSGLHLQCTQVSHQKECSSGETVSTQESCSNDHSETLSNASSGASTFFSSSQDPFYHIGRFLDKVNQEPEEHQQKLWTFLASVVQKGLKSCPGGAKDQKETIVSPYTAVSVELKRVNKSQGEGELSQLSQDLSPAAGGLHSSAVKKLNQTLMPDTDVVPPSPEDNFKEEKNSLTNTTSVCAAASEGTSTEVLSGCKEPQEEAESRIIYLIEGKGSAESSVLANPVGPLIFKRACAESTGMFDSGYGAPFIQAESNTDCPSVSSHLALEQQNNMPDIVGSSQSKEYCGLAWPGITNSTYQAQDFLLTRGFPLQDASFNTQTVDVAQKGLQNDAIRPEFLKKLFAMGLISSQRIPSALGIKFRKQDLSGANVGSAMPKPSNSIMPETWHTNMAGHFEPPLPCGRDSFVDKTTKAITQPLGMLEINQANLCSKPLARHKSQLLNNTSIVKGQPCDHPLDSLSNYDSSIVSYKILSPRPKENPVFDFKSLIPQSRVESEGNVLFFFLLNAMTFHINLGCSIIVSKQDFIFWCPVVHGCVATRN